MKYKFIYEIGLSVRAYNCLNNAGVKTINELCRVDLKKLKNCGVKTEEEIKNKINELKELGYFYNEFFMDKNILQKYNKFCGMTNINELDISSKLKDKLNSYQIITIQDLILKKINNYNNEEYNSLYNFFYNIIYGTLKIKISEELKKIYVFIPFDLCNFKNGNLHKINDIINFSIKNFESLTLEEKINLKLYLYWLNSFEIESFENYIQDIFKLTERQKDILSKRVYMTLEEVGNLYDVTRERIRQIEADMIKKLKDKYLNLPFRYLDPLKIYYVNNSTEFEMFMMFLNNEFDKNYIYIDNNLKYYLPTYYINKINEFIEENKDSFEYNGYLEYINVFNKDIFYKSLNYLNLNYNNNFITKKLTKRMQVKYAMRYIGKPISLSNNDDLDLLIETVRQIYGVELEKGRGLEAIITDAGLRVDSGMYFSDDKIIPLSNEILNDIVDYINDKKIINTRDLYIKYGDILYSHNLNNEVILYRYLKEVLYDKLYFHGVSAVISSDETLSSWGDLVIKIIKETNKPIKKLDFMVKYAITEAVYTNLSINFTDIIQWSTKELYLKSMIKMPKELTDKLIEFISHKQIVSFDELIRIINNYDINLLINNNVITNENIYNFFINIFDNNNFIIDKYSKEVRCINRNKIVIKEEYSETEELTL